MREPSRSWVSLITFCALAVLLAALGSAAIFAGASVAFAVAHPAQSVEVTANTEAPGVQPAEHQTFVEQATAEPPSPQAPANAQTIDDGAGDGSATFAGMITDSRCGARHRMNSGKTSAECVRSCVHKGAHYVLVDGEKVYILRGDPVQLEKRAGERVKIVGVLEGDTIKVKSVVAG